MIGNYGSFTYDLAQCLGKLGAELGVRRNHAVDVAGAYRGFLEYHAWTSNYPTRSTKL